MKMRMVSGALVGAEIVMVCGQENLGGKESQLGFNCPFR